MAAIKSSSIHLIVTFLLFLLPFLSISADPDFLQDFCVADLRARQTLNGFPCKPSSEVTSEDFFFDGLSKPGNTRNSFLAGATLGNVRTFPGLNTQGLSMNRVDFAPGGLNPAHIHPRATETGVVTEGKVLVGFVTTGNVYYSKVLTTGHMFVVPRGLVHFQLNVGKGKATIITAFNSQLPGTVRLNVNLFGSRPAIQSKMKSSSIHLIFGFLAFLLLPFLSISADPDMLQDFCVADLKARQTINGFPCKPQSEVNSHDFFFDGLTKPGNTGNSFGSAVTPGDVRFFPGINTLGLSMNRVDLAPGGLNPAHTHPRATETGVVIEGNVLVGFVTTDNVYYSKELTAGQMFVIPRGLVHFQLNIGKGKAMIITAFNSQQPGVVMLNVNLFGSRPSIPNEVLTKGFRVGRDVIGQIKSKFGS